MATREVINKPTSLPPYPEIILEAIQALNEGKGCNKSSISKYIESTYGGLPQGHKVSLNVHLAKMRDTGVLVFWKNNYTKHDPNAPPRRGRGRPPKPKELKPQGTPLSLAKSRGRPPKDQLKLSTGSGRPRGRPRKMAWPAGGFGEVPPFTVKVGAGGGPRGRPPKLKHMLTEIEVGA